MSTHSIPDPVHGTIKLNELEHKLINTKEFRRLKRIRQMSFAQYEYPSANHTRFEHSIGTLRLTKKIIESLKENSKKEHRDHIKKYRKHVRIAALLHDIGHAAYSHAMEHILSEHKDWTKDKLDHEINGYNIITKDSEINSILKEEGFTEKDIRLIAAIATEKKDELKPEEYYLTEIITGDTGSDRIDYLSRDAHHMGVPYGKIETSELFSSLSIAKIGPETHVCIRYTDERKGLRAATYLLISRKHHFESIVHQPKIRCANSMLKKSLELYLESVPDKAEQIRRCFTEYDDSDLIEKIATATDPEARRIARLIKAELPLREKEYIRLDDLPPALAFMLITINTNPDAKTALRNAIESRVKKENKIDETIIFDMDINGKSGIPSALFIDADDTRSCLMFDKSPLAEDLSLHLPKMGSLAIYSEQKLNVSFIDFTPEIIKSFEKIRKNKLIPEEALLIALRDAPENERQGLSKFMSCARRHFEKNGITPYTDFMQITDTFAYSPRLYTDLMLLASESMIIIKRTPRAITPTGRKTPTLENIKDTCTMVSRYDFELTDIGRDYIENIIVKKKQ